MSDSQVLLNRRANHHVAAEVLRLALSDFTVGAHASGGSIKLGCKIVGAKQLDASQGWIDSPGAAIEMLGGQRHRVSEDLPDMHREVGGEFRIVPAASLYCATYRLSVMLANKFDALDVQSQIDDLLRGYAPTGSAVSSELIGQRVFLSHPDASVRLRVDHGSWVTRTLRDGEMLHLEMDVEYELAERITVTFPVLSRLEFWFQIPPEDFLLREKIAVPNQS